MTEVVDSIVSRSRPKSSCLSPADTVEQVLKKYGIVNSSYRPLLQRTFQTQFSQDNKLNSTEHSEDISTHITTYPSKVLKTSQSKTPPEIIPEKKLPKVPESCFSDDAEKSYKAESESDQRFEKVPLNYRNNPNHDVWIPNIAKTNDSPIMKHQFFDDPTFFVPLQIKEKRLVLPPTPFSSKGKSNGDIIDLAKQFLNDGTLKDDSSEDSAQKVPKAETNPRGTQTDLTVDKLSELETKLHRLMVDKDALEEKVNQGTNLEAKISELEKLLKQSQDDNKKLKQKQKELTDDKTKYENDLKKQLEKSEKDSSSKIKDLETELDRLKKEKKTLESQTLSLKKSLEKTKLDFEGKVAELQSELEKEKVVSEQERNRNKELDSVVEKLKDDAEKAKKEAKSPKSPVVKFSPQEEIIESEEERRLRNGGDDGAWYSQYKGARKYKDLPEKQVIPGTKFELLPDAKQRAKNKANSQANSPISPSSSSTSEKPVSLEGTDEKMLKAAEDRQREREEQSWKKHEKQLEDMKEYYESEIKDLEEKLKTQNDAIGGKTTGSMEQSEQSLREKNRLLKLKDQQILELQQKQASLPMELEKANAHIQSLTLELEKVQRGKPGKRFNPTYEPSQVENGLMTNPGLYPPTPVSPFQARPNMPVSPFPMHLHPPGIIRT